jgi:pyruvate-formate lyase-activating enzyme
MRASPITVTADCSGRIRDFPDLSAAGRSGRSIFPLDPAQLIPLPPASRLFLLPGRHPIGFSPAGGALVEPERFAVAADLPPGYVALALAAYATEKNASQLPLFCYGAVCWHRGRFQVPALRIDRDPKHDPTRFDRRQIYREVDRWLRRYPQNRLVAHHGLRCVKQYGCPNAANLFLRRWEAPVAVSGGCNAACRGCISKQASAAPPPPQARIGFVPTVAEILEIAVPHLEKAPRAMISFGQGCEGEPLLRGDLIAAAIRAIRARTQRGVIHLNTNGSLPDMVARLAAAGLDSIRISLNSARPPLYAAYYRCRNYSFEDVLDSFCIARLAGIWVSVNYLTFPGVSDDPAEFAAFAEFLRKTRPDMIQWRNLNTDPERYLDLVERTCPAGQAHPLGIPVLLRRIRRQFPKIRHGYFNPCFSPGGHGHLARHPFGQRRWNRAG